MDVVVLIGRVIFVALFVGGALNHFTQAAPMGEFATSKGLPAGKILVVASGVQLLVGGLSVLLGVWADLGALILALFLVVAAVTMHDFWKLTDPEAKQADQAQFMKNIALAGACLMLFGFFAHVGDLGLTLTGPLFELN